MEYSPNRGQHIVYGANNAPFVSTNFYLSPAWGPMATPTNDSTTWMAYTRRANMLRQIGQLQHGTVADAQRIMDLTIEQGGARDGDTVYQVES